MTWFEKMMDEVKDTPEFQRELRYCENAVDIVWPPTKEGEMNEMHEIETIRKTAERVPDSANWSNKTVKLLVAEITRLETENKDLRFKLSCHTRDCIADYMELENKMKELEVVINIAIESQGWDGNNPNDDRWIDFYEKAKSAIKGKR